MSYCYCMCNLGWLRKVLLFTVKHLKSAVSNIRGLLKLANWGILILAFITIAPDGREHLMYL